MVKTANPTAPAHNVMLRAESGEKEDFFFALSSSPALYFVFCSRARDIPVDAVHLKTGLLHIGKDQIVNPVLKEFAGRHITLFRAGNTGNNGFTCH